MRLTHMVSKPNGDCLSIRESKVATRFASRAGYTRAYGLYAYLHDLGFYAVLLQLPGYFAQRDKRVALLVRTGIHQKDFHIL